MKTKLLELLRRGAGNRLASKTTINLAAKEETSRPVELMTVGIVLIVIVALLVAKFGVYDQFKRVSDAEHTYTELRQEVDALQEEAKKFDSVRTEYLRYTRGWMQQKKEKEPVIGVDRQDAIRLVDEVFAPYGQIVSVTVESVLDKKSGESSDYLEVMIGTPSMNTASDVLAVVRQHPLCEDAQLQVSESDEYEAYGLVRSTVRVKLKDSGESDGK